LGREEKGVLVTQATRRRGRATLPAAPASRACVTTNPFHNTYPHASLHASSVIQVGSRHNYSGIPGIKDIRCLIQWTLPLGWVYSRRMIRRTKLRQESCNFRSTVPYNPCFMLKVAKNSQELFENKAIRTGRVTSESNKIRKILFLHSKTD